MILNSFTGKNKRESIRGDEQLPDSCRRMLQYSAFPAMLQDYNTKVRPNIHQKALEKFAMILCDDFMRWACNVPIESCLGSEGRQNKNSLQWREGSPKSYGWEIRCFTYGRSIKRSTCTIVSVINPFLSFRGSEDFVLASICCYSRDDGSLLYSEDVTFDAKSNHGSRGFVLKPNTDIPELSFYYRESLNFFYCCIWRHEVRFCPYYNLRRPTPNCKHFANGGFGEVHCFKQYIRRKMLHLICHKPGVSDIRPARCFNPARPGICKKILEMVSSE